VPRRAARRRRVPQRPELQTHRLRAFLKDAIEVLGDRRAALAKELTKIFESVKRGRLSELLAGLDEKLKGEYVVVIAGNEDERSDKC